MKTINHPENGNAAPVRRDLPLTVEHFDRMPNSAHVDLNALKALTGKSRATIYNWIGSGILPKPRKLGQTRNFWLAGEIRKALSV